MIRTVVKSPTVCARDAPAADGHSIAFFPKELSSATVWSILVVDNPLLMLLWNCCHHRLLGQSCFGVFFCECLRFNGKSETYPSASSLLFVAVTSNKKERIILFYEKGSIILFNY